MEKICKACGKTKDTKHFYKNGQKLLSRCKSCFINGIKISKKVTPKIRFIDVPLRLTATKKSDYIGMYILLKAIGYDCEKGNIHEQFLKKWGLNGKHKSKFHTSPKYLCNGELNPNYRKKKEL